MLCVIDCSFECVSCYRLNAARSWFHFSWESFSHDEAAFRAYTSGEDGLLGVCDDRAQLCQAVALWNGVDIRLKERFFGLTGPQVYRDSDLTDYYYILVQYLR